MFNKFLRENKVAAYILTVFRLYLGYEWLTAGFHKITGGFDATGFLKGAIANPVKGPEWRPGLCHLRWILKTLCIAQCPYI
jgi:thiosulfate dehydrogenase [quinone] large subunit